MKPTKLITLTIALLMLSVALLSNVAYVLATPPATYESFTLTATGQAFDPAMVEVTLTLTGSVNGHSKMVFSLQVEGGTASVDGYDTISVMKGSGVLVQPSEYLHLSLMMDKAYGGSHAAWVLSGETIGELESGSVPISIVAARVVLPQPSGCVMLTDLSLTGTISFS